MPNKRLKLVKSNFYIATLKCLGTKPATDFIKVKPRWRDYRHMHTEERV